MATRSKTTVKAQITDAVTQSNEKVVADAPAGAIGSLYNTLTHYLGISYQNSVATQQQMNTIAQATTAQGVAMIYSVGTAADAVDIAEILDEMPAAKVKKRK